MPETFYFPVWSKQAWEVGARCSQGNAVDRINGVVRKSAVCARQYARHLNSAPELLLEVVLQRFCKLLASMILLMVVSHFRLHFV